MDDSTAPQGHPACAPLGKLVIEKSFSTKKRPHAAADGSDLASRRGPYRNVNASRRGSARTWSASGSAHGASMTPGGRSSRSIARADGAVADTLHVATHGPDGEIMDDYTTLPWPALCAEVSKAKISLREGEQVASGPEPGLAAVLEPTGIIDESWRSGRDLKTRTMLRGGAPRAAVARFVRSMERRVSPSGRECHRCS
jgi:hypothetical protein